MYTFILITLGLLAILGIVVGVSNDAVNFLNSAFGSKAASRRVILSVASLGILLGVMTSSGMMEVARNGVFYPSQFTFEQIMTLFLGMMLGNIILLDIFNSLGLPTSTTVSLVLGYGRRPDDDMGQRRSYAGRSVGIYQLGQGHGYHIGHTAVGRHSLRHGTDTDVRLAPAVLVPL